MRAPKTNTEVRREQIARSALGVIARHGFHQLKIAQVAREVGVVPSAIYRHFPGKDEMLDAVLDLVAARLLGNVAAVRETTANGLERLQQLLLRHAEMVEDDVPVPRIVFSEQIFAGHPKRRQRVHRMFQDYLAGIAALLREAQRAGEVRPDLDARTVAVIFLGLVQPAAILWVMSDGAFDVTDHARRAWKQFAPWIAARPDRPESRRRTRPPVKRATPKPRRTP